MVILKCKMCGGDIEATDNTFGTCASCGSTMTLPKASDERKANMFNRANYYRQQCEFDKAVQAYENILNDDDSDAEAYWGVVLSRYGIEYVKDPTTHERIPTCHRVQGESIMSDADYLAALKYAADEYTKSLYEEEAKRISEIQKNVLAISVKEEPYDVFICYKETTDGGSRTKDSTIAQDIYYELTNDGYRVFFAKITLEDKLGQQYEPYIFSALNSAKVMLVIGTQKEYFNAVWLKNEWSRFLTIMKKDRSRILIPCYCDMDVYDIPDELSMLQSQDMNKIGFMQDLTRGVKKILAASKTVENADATSSTGVAVNAPGIDSLMKRGHLFIEDSEWKQADEYFNRVLDIDPEYAPAYIGKLLVEVKLTNESELGNYYKPLSDMPDYQKALRFATTEYKTKLEKYIEENIDQVKKRSDSDSVLIMAADLSKRGTLTDLRKAVEMFISIKGFKDADSHARITQEKYDDLMKRAESIYKDAFGRMSTARSIEAFEYAARQFATIEGYKNSDNLAKDCIKKVEQKRNWKDKGLCQYCGGQLIGTLLKKCKSCGSTA